MLKSKIVVLSTNLSTDNREKMDKKKKKKKKNEITRCLLSPVSQSHSQNITIVYSINECIISYVLKLSIICSKIFLFNGTTEEIVQFFSFSVPSFPAYLD